MCAWLSACIRTFEGMDVSMSAVYVVRGWLCAQDFISHEVKNSLWFKRVLKHPLFASLCHNRKEKKSNKNPL